MKYLLAFALPFAALAAAPANAEPVNHVEYVKLSDLDLTTAEGRAELDRRLDETIKSVCGGPDMTQRDPLTAMWHCRWRAKVDVKQKRESAVASAGRQKVQLAELTREW